MAHSIGSRKKRKSNNYGPICKCGHRFGAHRDGAIVGMGLVCWHIDRKKGGLCGCEDFVARIFPRDALQEMAEA
jgi:hypothetical protein